MEDSILNSIKKLLGIASDYDNFDSDIIMHINSVFMILNQLGVGPSDGYRITDDTAEWDDYMESDQNLEAVKSYIYLKVKLLFDPPAGGAVMDATKQMINELEWRLSTEAESN